MKDWVALRYEQMKRLAPAISLCLQSATLAGVIYGLVAWRGMGLWLAPAIAAGLLGGAAVAAWLYYDVLQMRVSEREAWLHLDPYQHDRLTPKEAKLLHLAVAAMGGDEDALLSLEDAARCRRL